MIKCEICKKNLVSTKALSQHIRNHKISSEEYYRKFIQEHRKEGTCEQCGDPTKFKGLTKGFQKFCGLKCSNNNECRKEKFRKSYLLNDMKQTKCKREKTNLKRYGDKIANNNEDIKEKTRKTCMDKYGVDNPMKSKKVQEKMNKTRSSSVMGPFPNGLNSFKWKKFEFPSGKIVKIQGFEDRLILKLLKFLNEREILVHNKVPTIEYVDYYGKKRKHYPDIFVPRYNWIFECKSNYTWFPNEVIRENNKLKMLYAKKLGFNYNIVICT